MRECWGISVYRFFSFLFHLFGWFSVVWALLTAVHSIGFFHIHDEFATVKVPKLLDKSVSLSLENNPELLLCV